MRLVSLLLLVLILQIPTATQEAGGSIRKSCDPRAIAAMESVSDEFDYANACQIYETCNPLRNLSTVCQFEAVNTLLQACADELCQKSTLLFAATLEIFYDYDDHPWDAPPPPTIIEGVPQGLAAFLAGDYEQALQAYLQTPSEDYTNHMLLFSQGIIYEQLGRLDEALAAYDAALEIDPESVIVRYARTQLYGKLGRSIEAAFEAAWLARFTAATPDLLPLMASLVEAFPLDGSQYKPWMVYPITSVSWELSGLIYTDRSMEPPSKVDVMIDPEIGIFALGLDQASSYDFSPEDMLRDAYLLRQNDQGDFVYEYLIGSEFITFFTLKLTPLSDSYLGNNRMRAHEYLQQSSFILAPEGASDPRLGLERCGVVSRLQEGMIVRSAVDFEYNGDQFPSLYNAPNGEIIQASLKSVHLTVMEKSECVNNNQSWWQVSTPEGAIGWIRENNRQTYLFNPTEEDANWVKLDLP